MRFYVEMRKAENQETLIFRGISGVPERPTEEPLRLIWYMHLDVFAIEGLL